MEFPKREIRHLMNFNRTHIVILILVLAGFLYFRDRDNEAPPPRPSAPAKPAQIPEPEPQPRLEPESAPMRLPDPVPHAVKIVKDKDESKQLALPYRIQNGLFVVQGDMLAGAVPKGETPPEDGLVAMEPLKLWPGGVIPYHIQPDVPNPERIEQAIRMFDGTNVRFVKYEAGDHALVFENGDKNCLSYVGKVVAKQPILLSPECSPADIAHEILHALGFVHEQNRADRDAYVDVLLDNIEDDQKHNFEKLPPDYMKLSGLGEFDYESLMMYPPWMFAKPGQVTMEPKSRDRLIAPQPRPSRGDIERLNRAYR